MTVIVLDACAMLAVLSDESGADIVENAYDKAASGEVVLMMHSVNLLEVYYELFRAYGKERADEIHDEIIRLPIRIVHEISDDIFMTAGRLKASYKISLADSFALAQALAIGGELLTSDHHEFGPIEGNEPIVFHWIR